MNIILFVYEGERHEPEYMNSLIQKTNLNLKGVIIETAFCTHIYELYNVIEGFDTVEDKIYKLFKRQKLKTISDSAVSVPTREQIAETYLFFDYDGHAPEAHDEEIQKMLKIFDNETEQGKLYISYPMLEALRDTKNLVFKIEDGKKYKYNVGNTGVQNIARLNEQEFKDLTLNHLKKANDLVNNTSKVPEQLIEQSDIFSAQLRKHIKSKREVAVLSAFPLFYLDYKGVSVLKLL